MELAERLALQLAIILVAGALVGLALRPLRQPQVVGEMVAGLLLGASIFGAIAPRLQDSIFPLKQVVDGVTMRHPSMVILYALGQLGIVLYMFLVGARLNLGLLGAHIGEAGRISLIGILIPAAAGAALGVAVATNHELFPPGVSRVQAGLFLASAMAVTAFPVLARILTDIGSANTRIGTLAISAAAFDDAAAWSLLALTLALAQGSAAGAVVTLGGAVIYAFVMIFGLRPLLERLDLRPEQNLTPLLLTTILAYLMVCAAFTEAIGVHAVFGAFIAGAVLPRGRLVELLGLAMESLTTKLLLPVFFVYAGLNTHIGLLRDRELFWIGLLIILLAFVCKGGGCALAMRYGGASWRESGALGSLMNARGLMELTLISIGLERGLIAPGLYTILALMAIATTMAAPPLFLWLHRPERSPLGTGRLAPSPATGSSDS